MFFQASRVESDQRQVLGVSPQITEGRGIDTNADRGLFEANVLDTLRIWFSLDVIRYTGAWDETQRMIHFLASLLE